jgi:hypothetical protein
VTPPLMLPPEPWDRDYIVTRPAPVRPAPRMRLHVAVTVALAGLAGGLVGADAAVIVHRGGHIARPAVDAPAPEPNPSPVLIASGGAR